MAKKVIVVIAVTGTQGSSVAEVFLDTPGWEVRGLARDPSKPKARELANNGVKIIRGDVDDVASIKAAVAGADYVFGYTVFPHDFMDPDAFDKKLLKPGQTVREWCYEQEYNHGRNIADAVASVDGLEMFIFSALSGARKWSKGKYKGVYHFDSKADVVEYVRSSLPALAKKMSVLQMGFFTTNWRKNRVSAPWEKLPDGSMHLQIPGSGDMPVPHVVASEAGQYVKAITQVPAGKTVLAFSDMMTWAEYVRLWSKTTGIPAKFSKTTVADHDKLAPGGLGEEIGEMHAYAQEFGYDGSDPSVTYARDLGVPLQVTSIEDVIKHEDWSAITK